MQVNRLPFLFLLCLLFIGGETTGADKKPNIILILADDLGYRGIGAYGQKMIHTPHLDALANSGMRFTNYYSGSSVCAPSRETLLTGMHTGHTFIRGNFLTDEQEDPPMPSDKVTIAEYLRKAGYQTALFGKWGLGGEAHGPEKQGFDNSFCYLDQIKAHDYYPPFLYENGKKVIIKANENGVKGEYSHQLFANKTLDYVNGRSADHPFFLYLPYTLPHGKYELPPDTPYISKDWTEQFKVYATMVSLLDRDIGRLVAALKQKGLIENTLILFSSDNGANTAFAKFFNANGPFSGSKFGFYEGGIHVPFIASWPGKIKQGVSADHIAASWDVLPTICDAAGITTPPAIDGISFMPLLTGKKQVAHASLYWEYYDYNYNWNKPNNLLPRNYLDSRAARTGKWKGMQKNMYKDKASLLELYDLEADPGEKKDVAAQHPEIVAEMQKLFASSTIGNTPFFPYKKQAF